MTIWSRPVRTTPSWRSSRRTRTTTSRAVPTASASSRWLTLTTSSDPDRCSDAGSGTRSDARSSRCRATRWRTVANALPEISQTKLSTRSLTSLRRAVATRTSRSAARRAIVGDILSSSASTSAWVGAGIAYPVANSDTAPMSAPGRQ